MKNKHQLIYLPVVFLVLLSFNLLAAPLKPCGNQFGSPAPSSIMDKMNDCVSRNGFVGSGSLQLLSVVDLSTGNRVVGWIYGWGDSNNTWHYEISAVYYNIGNNSQSIDCKNAVKDLNMDTHFFSLGSVTDSGNRCDGVAVIGNVNLLSGSLVEEKTSMVRN